MLVDDAAQKWARLRFAIIAQLLAAPPERGSLQQTIAELSKQKWKLPTGELETFGFSTIERWYYAAIKANNPIETLRRQSRKDAGKEKAVTAQHLKELEALYKANPHWSYQLHADNLQALALEKPELNPLPSKTSIRRVMKKHGWRKKKLPKNKGQQCAAQRIESRETRSYEMEHVHALWHLDFHKAKTVQVLMPDGSWETPVCLCILDDFCRLCCHIQWYLTESAETLGHGLWQAFLKRGLPYSILSDNGRAMIAAENENGMSELSVLHETTLEYSPQQNGKQERFWGNLEGRLMAMLRNVKPLKLDFLNRATQAWAEQEYNRTTHEEIKIAPIKRLLSGKNLARHSPNLEKIQFHFTRIENRIQRRTDGTISIDNVRFEIPGQMRHFDKLKVRFASWDLSRAFIVDPRHNTQILATVYPQNKAQNANGFRRVFEPAVVATPVKPEQPIPPLLRKYIADYAATGIPPAYLPHESEMREENENA